MDKPRDALPYNRLEITGTFTLDDDGSFESISVTFTDYTLVKDRVSSTLPTLRVGDKWAPIPKPKSSDATSSGTGKSSDPAQDASDAKNTADQAPKSGSGATGDDFGSKDTGGGSGCSSSGGSGTGTGGNTPASTFTVDGEVRIQSVASGHYLRVRLTYGHSRVREELGFVFALGAPNSGQGKG